MSTAGSKLERVHRELREELDEGGLDQFAALLEGKQRYLADAWGAGRDPIARAAPVIFGLRNKDEAFLRPFRSEALQERIRHAVDSLTGGEPALEVLGKAVDLPELSPRQRRVLWNLIAELAHFRDPEAVSLDTLWVTGEQRSMGALDYLFGRDPEQGVSAVEPRHGRVREWLQEAGFYRQLPFVQDVYYAKAYVLYMVEMTEGMGLLDQQFGQGIHAVDYMSKLLGVDPASSRHWLQ